MQFIQTRLLVLVPKHWCEWYFTSSRPQTTFQWYCFELMNVKTPNCVKIRHRRTNIFWPFSSRFISSRFMKSWSVTVKTVWYLKSAGQTVKTGKSREIGPFSFCSSRLLWNETSKNMLARLKRNETSEIWRSDGQTMIDRRCLVKIPKTFDFKRNYCICGEGKRAIYICGQCYKLFGAKCQFCQIY